MPPSRGVARWSPRRSRRECGHRVVLQKVSYLHSKTIITMTAPHIVNPAGLLSEALTDASQDLMPHPAATTINALLSADAVAEWRRPRLTVSL
jgi:hypothetical protein